MTYELLDGSTIMLNHIVHDADEFGSCDCRLAPWPLSEPDTLLGRLKQHTLAIQIDRTFQDEKKERETIPADGNVSPFILGFGAIAFMTMVWFVAK